MTITEAASKLNAMYSKGAQNKEQVAMIHLFAIKYVDEIKTMSLKDILIEAEMPDSYKTELRKGMNLAKYVQPKPTD